MSQVNLLPPEIRQRQVTRRTTSLVVLAGGVVVVILLGFYFLQTLNLSSARSDLEVQQRTNGQLQRDIQSLSEFAKLQADVQDRQKLLDTVLANEVSWSSVLMDLSRIVPGPSYLTNVDGKITAPTGTPTAGAAAAPTTGGANLIGTLQFQGLALDARTIAEWLTRLEQIRGWVNPWVSTATESQPGTKQYTFTSTVDLSKAATAKPKAVQP